MIDVGCGVDFGEPWNEEIYIKYVDSFLGFDPRGRYDFLENQNKNVFLYEKAVFNKEGYFNFYVCRGGEQSSLFKPNLPIVKEYLMKGTKKLPRRNKRHKFDIKKTEKIKCIRLDSILNILDINFDFIKIDTQGADLNVIKSLGKYLDSQIIAIHTELYFKEMYMGISLFKDAHYFLKKHGFEKMKKMANNDFYSDFLYIRQNDKKQNKINLIKEIYEIDNWR